MVYGMKNNERQFCFDLPEQNLNVSSVLGNNETQPTQTNSWNKYCFFPKSLEPMCIAGMDGYFKHLNPAFISTLGYSQSELLAIPFFELIHPEDRSATATQLEKLKSGNKITKFENRYRCLDGSYKWLEWTSKPDVDSQLIYATAHDITERKEREDFLKAKLDKYELFIDAVKDYAIFSIDLQGKIISWNKGAEHFFGYSELEIIDCPFTILFTPSDRENGIPEWELTQAEEADRAPDNRWHMRKDGSLIFVAGQVVPIRDRVGKLIGYTKIVRDLTENKLAQEKIQESQERFNLVLDASEIGFWYCDLPPNVLSLDDRCKKLFGLSPETDVNEVNIDLFYELLHPEDRNRTREKFDRALRDRTKYDLDFRVVASDGQQRWLRALGKCFYNENGHPIRFDGITIDISERKQVEEERSLLLQAERMARAEAERAARIKDEFLAVISHELRTPLNAIVGWSGLLLRNRLDESESRKAISIINRNTKLQVQLINDLLDISQISQGKLNFNISDVNLETTVNAAIETVRLAAEAKSIQIKTELPSVALTVKGDANRLQQVVWNLLTNAIKFTNHGGSITIRLKRIGKKAQLTVSDTGKGIEPEFLSRIFEYFYQEDSSITRRFGGLGLGLAIAKHIVELHGGIVRAKSLGEGTGATFIVRLPLAKTKQPNNPQSDRSQTNIDLNGVKILVVDDQVDSVELINLTLNIYGAEVTTASSASEALVLFDRIQPDLLVSDIAMPEMNGLELIQRIRNLPPERGGNINAIALTAYASEDERQLVLSMGYQQHLAKPVNLEELVAVVARFIENRNLKRSYG
jgi:PAS domain S-box-containing protein